MSRDENQKNQTNRIKNEVLTDTVSNEEVTVFSEEKMKETSEEKIIVFSEEEMIGGIPKDVLIKGIADDWYDSDDKGKHDESFIYRELKAYNDKCARAISGQLEELVQGAWEKSLEKLPVNSKAENKKDASKKSTAEIRKGALNNSTAEIRKDSLKNSKRKSLYQFLEAIRYAYEKEKISSGKALDLLYKSILSDKKASMDHDLKDVIERIGNCKIADEKNLADELLKEKKSPVARYQDKRLRALVSNRLKKYGLCVIRKSDTPKNEENYNEDYYVSLYHSNRKKTNTDTPGQRIPLNKLNNAVDANSADKSENSNYAKNSDSANNLNSSSNKNNLIHSNPNNNKNNPNHMDRMGGYQKTDALLQRFAEFYGKSHGLKFISGSSYGINTLSSGDQSEADFAGRSEEEYWKLCDRLFDWLNSSPYRENAEKVLIRIWIQAGSGSGIFVIGKQKLEEDLWKWFAEQYDPDDKDGYRCCIAVLSFQEFDVNGEDIYFTQIPYFFKDFDSARNYLISSSDETYDKFNDENDEANLSEILPEDLQFFINQNLFRPMSASEAKTIDEYKKKMEEEEKRKKKK